MVRQAVVHAEAGEPPNGEVDLRLSHQPAVVDEPQQEARKHQPNRSFWLDPWSADSVGVKFSDFIVQPGKIQHPVDAGETMIVGDQVAK
jgi:hypothetical protein